jgi:hypothetical protein
MDDFSVGDDFSVKLVEEKDSEGYAVFEKKMKDSNELLFYNPDYFRAIGVSDFTITLISNVDGQTQEMKGGGWYDSPEKLSWPFRQFVYFVQGFSPKNGFFGMLFKKSATKEDLNPLTVGVKEEQNPLTVGVKEDLNPLTVGVKEEQNPLTGNAKETEQPKVADGLKNSLNGLLTQTNPTEVRDLVETKPAEKESRWNSLYNSWLRPTKVEEPEAKQPTEDTSAEDTSAGEPEVKIEKIRIRIKTLKVSGEEEEERRRNIIVDGKRWQIGEESIKLAEKIRIRTSGDNNPKVEEPANAPVVPSTEEVKTDDVPVVSTEEVKTDDVPVVSTEEVKPDDVPVVSTEEVKPDDVPVVNTEEVKSADRSELPGSVENKRARLNKYKKELGI